MTIRVAMVMHGPGEQALMPIFAAKCVEAGAEVTVLTKKCTECGQPALGKETRDELLRLGLEVVACTESELKGRMSPTLRVDVVVSGLQTEQQVNAVRCAKENRNKLPVVGFAELLIRRHENGVTRKPPGGSERYPRVVEQCSALIVPEALRTAAGEYLADAAPEGADVLSLGLSDTLDRNRLTGERVPLLFIAQRHREGQVKLVDEFKSAASSLHLESCMLDHPAKKGSRRIKLCPKHSKPKPKPPHADVVVTEYSNLAYAYALRGSQVIYCMEEGIRPRLLPMEDPRFPNCRWASPGGLQTAIEAALQRAESFDAQTLPVPDTDAGPFLEWVGNNLP